MLLGWLWIGDACAYNRCPDLSGAIVNSLLIRPLKFWSTSSFPERFRSRRIVVEELLVYMDDRRRSAWRHSLPSPPGVDPFDQLRLDPDIDVGCLPFHAREVGLCEAALLDNPGRKIDMRNFS